MAVYFGLSVEAGTDVKAVDALDGFFADARLSAVNGEPVACRTFRYQAIDAAWWLTVWPLGASQGSPFGDRPALTERAATTALGWNLYELLRGAPLYRFALVGWEAAEARSYQDLQGNLQAEAVAGLVVNELLVSRAVPSGFEPFSHGFWWLPYKGETWG